MNSRFASAHGSLELESTQLSAQEFRRRFRHLVLLTWIVPPVFGLSFLLFLRIFTPEQIVGILVTPIEPVFIVASLTFAYWYLNRHVRPIAVWLDTDRINHRESVLDCMRTFPLHYWGLFLAYLLLAPVSVIVAAEIYTDFVARPVDWFRVHLVALIVSIIVGLPIFFMVLDLFGRAVAGIPLRRPHLTIRTKVFLIGALVPLLIDTTLVQYFWTRTGYFTTETFFMWLILELLAIGGSLLFARSFGQSLMPLREFILARSVSRDFDVSRLLACSTDELGVITSDIRGLAEQLKFQSDILEIRNQVLAASNATDMLEEAFITILDIADVALGNDKTFLLVYDPFSDELVNVAYSGAKYNEAGHYRLSLVGDSSLAVLAYKSGQTIVVEDVSRDERVNREVAQEQKLLSAIATPLRYGDSLVGVLISTNSVEYRNYGTREIRLIEVLAQEAALVTNTIMLYQEQQRAERRYRQLNELAPDAILLMDNRQRLVEVNRAAEELLGRERASLIGVEIGNFITACTSDYLLGGMDRIPPGETVRCQATLAVERHGSPVIVEIHASRLELGGTSMVQAFLRDVTASQQAENSLRRSEQELSGILNSLQDTFYRTDTEGRIVRISPSVMKLLGYTAQELLGRKLSYLYADQDGYRKYLEEIQNNDGVVRAYQVALRRKDGSVVWVSTNAQHYVDDHGDVAGIEGTTRDMTKYRRTQEELFKEKERAQVTLESIGDGVITTDVNGAIEYINPVAEQICGWSVEEAENQPFGKIFHFLEESTRLTIESPILQCLEKRHPITSDVDTILVGRHGREFAVEFSASPIRDRTGGLIGVVLGLHDVTEMRQLAQQLSHQATHDSLTGLINRHEFEMRLKGALDSALHDGVQHALCYLDLDQFKVVNDTCGHIAGDKLLKQVTALLREKVRKADTLARLGGDEFGVLLWDCPLATAQKVSEDLRKAVKDFRFSWEDRVFEVGVSIGLVPIIENSGTLTDVLSAADSACYAAKDQGRNRVHVYQPDDQLLSQRHGEMQWVSRITSALEEDRLVIFGQRIKSLVTGEIDHWELLVRLRGENGELVPPMAFIPAAERYHIMPAIDRWVLETAITMMAEYDYLREADAPVFNFNLSGQSLSDDSLLQYIIDQAENNTINPDKICFEITETAAIADLAHASRFIAVITGLGCRFALDDFGSGLSSFAYLKNLNVSYLKIDGAFVRNMVDDAIDYAMVESINHVGHILGIKTIAEFVESEEVLSAVSALGIDFAQGYAIARPVAIDKEFFADKDKLVSHHKLH